LALSANFAHNECFYFGGYGFGQEVEEGKYGEELPRRF
jgi:hypothetical protein